MPDAAASDRRPANRRRRCPLLLSEQESALRRMSLLERTTSARLVVGRETAHRRGGARVGAARSRCRGAAALLPEAKHQPRPSDPVLAHLRADDREQAVAHTHRAPRAEHGSNSQELPRRADAISKAGVRRLDTGRVVCHGLSREVAILLPRGAVVRSRGYCFQGKESPVGSAAAVAKA